MYYIPFYLIRTKWKRQTDPTDRMEQLRHHWCDEDGCPGRLRRHVDPTSTTVSSSDADNSIYIDSKEPPLSPLDEDNTHNIIRFAKIEAMDNESFSENSDDDVIEYKMSPKRPV